MGVVVAAAAVMLTCYLLFMLKIFMLFILCNVFIYVFLSYLNSGSVSSE